MPLESRSAFVEHRVHAVVEHTPEPSGEDSRFVIAIAGPPASGKSTLATALAAELGGRAAVLGQDAFHFDDLILRERGWRERKGAPHTFDVAAYETWLSMLRTSRSEVAVPVFDRELELTRNCAEVITADHDIVITEGNYLLLNDDRWAPLRMHFDFTVMLIEPLEEIERRIHARWVEHGIDSAEIERRVHENDLPNARLVVEQSVPADLDLA